MRMMLVLDDGNVFRGKAIGHIRETVGEVVFNTGMTGYQEVLTDSSYYGQIVLMTYPLIGNYGVNVTDAGCRNIMASGLVVRHLCKHPSNYRSEKTMEEFLKDHQIPGIEEIDTRAVTRILRKKGTMTGMLIPEKEYEPGIVRKKLSEYRNHDPVERVTAAVPRHIPGDGHRVAVLDMGLHPGILRSLADRGMDITVLPASTKSDVILRKGYEGLVVSNGPGDPKDCRNEISCLRHVIGRIPVLGICLGHQLVCLAMGGDTVKLPHGHRGGNHPIKDLQHNRVFITSQNHGYAVLTDSLRYSGLIVTYINWNDRTVEGVRHSSIPLLAVQFLPESFPDPRDTGHVFDQFTAMMVQCSKGGHYAKA